jgi:uncharacterized protein (TIGR02611 family)
MVAKPSSMEHRAPLGSQREEPPGIGSVDGAQPADERRWDVPDEPGAQREPEPARPAAPAPGTAVARREAGRRGRLRLTLDLIRSNPTGRIALKIFVAIAGAVVVAVGLALIPLPGPGWLVVIGGLAIWAVEFHWARRLLTFTRRNVQAWTRWITHQSLPARILAAAVGLAFISVVVWLSLKYSLGIDLVADLLRYLATH